MEGPCTERVTASAPMTTPATQIEQEVKAGIIMAAADYIVDRRENNAEPKYDEKEVEKRGWFRIG